MSTTNKICIGLMSGTSLDGLDIVACQFKKNNKSYDYKILHSNTLAYPEEFKKRLENCTVLNGLELTKLNHELGKYFGKCVNQFIIDFHLDRKDIEFIASHGHTVFHQPENGFTLQIGHGANIAFETKIETIADFRIENVIRGGQGAPLVPIGDELLFNDFDACINLGGFCNISFQKNKQRIAFDIAPCNLPLNTLAKLWGQSYDKNGDIANKGVTDQKLLKKLNSLDYYKATPPKSLGVEWLNNSFYPLYANEKDPNIMATLVEHITDQIKAILAFEKLDKVLLTGGGAYNKHLIDVLKSKCFSEIVFPDKELVEYKEALIFAFLGWCKKEGINNTLASVTGSKTDNCNGIVYKT